MTRCWKIILHWHTLKQTPPPPHTHTPTSPPSDTHANPSPQPYHSVSTPPPPHTHTLTILPQPHPSYSPPIHTLTHPHPPTHPTHTHNIHQQPQQQRQQKRISMSGQQPLISVASWVKTELQSVMSVLPLEQPATQPSSRECECLSPGGFIACTVPGHLLALLLRNLSSTAFVFSARYDV